MKDNFKATPVGAVENAPTRTIRKAKLSNCNRLNVRSGKSVKATPVGVIGVNDRIRVDLSASNGEWCNVIEPIYGFAMRKYLEVL